MHIIKALSKRCRIEINRYVTGHHIKTLTTYQMLQQNQIHYFNLSV